VTREDAIAHIEQGAQRHPAGGTHHPPEIGGVVSQAQHFHAVQHRAVSAQAMQICVHVSQGDAVRRRGRRHPAIRDP